MLFKIGGSLLIVAGLGHLIADGHPVLAIGECFIGWIIASKLWEHA